MITINLLAKNTTRKARWHLNFKEFLIVLFAWLVLIFLMHIGFAKWVKTTNIEIEMIQKKLVQQLKISDVVLADYKVTQKILTALRFIEATETGRDGTLMLIQKLLTETPLEVYFTRLEVNSNYILLNGMSNTPLGLMLLIKKLNISTAWQKVKIVQLQKIISSSKIKFQLRVERDASSVTKYRA